MLKRRDVVENSREDENVEDEDEVVDDDFDDEVLKEAAEINAINSSLADGLRQTVTTQQERVERVQAVDNELKSHKL